MGAGAWWWLCGEPRRVLHVPGRGRCACDTAEQLDLISSDSQVMHGQAVFLTMPVVRRWSRPDELSGK
jgi:hypothetical protein